MKTLWSIWLVHDIPLKYAPPHLKWMNLYRPFHSELGWSGQLTQATPVRTPSLGIWN